MSWRKWVVRSVVAVVLASCLGAGVVYQQWTNPAAVRVQVVDMLQRQFPGATVTLNGASLRLLGGVVLSELRLLRKGEGDADFVHIPQATVHLNKERLLDGQFAVCRIEMLRPNVRIARAKDGTWNLEGLTGKSSAAGALPTIVIQQGTLTVEDELAGPAVWEIQDVNLTLIQDTPDSLKFSGMGRSETFGALEVRGSWNRRSNATEVSLHANGLSITKNLLNYAFSLHPDERLKGLQLEGKADIVADVSYEPTAIPALQHQVQCVLRQVSVDHPKLPVALHNLSASLRCDANRIILEGLRAAAGSGKIECRGWADMADPEHNFGGELIAHHLPVTKDLADRLPSPVPRLFELFRPVGRAKACFWAEKKNGEWMRKYCTLEPDNIAICFEKFQYPLDRVTGTVDYDYVQKVSKFETVGYSGDRPITVRGIWKGGMVLEADAYIEIAGENIPLDDKLILALKPALQKQAKAFHPVGKGNFHGVVLRKPGNLDYQSTYHMHFVDSIVKWDEFPYPLENVSGDLIVYPNERYEFRNFQGTHNGGQMFVSGFRESRQEGSGDAKLTINLVGRDLSLDSDLRQALAKFQGLGKAWDTFSPAGKLSFQAQVEQVQNQPQADLDISVDVAGFAIMPSFFLYPLEDVSGRFRYHKQRVDFANFTARHKTSQISISKGTVDVLEGGGFFAELDDFRGHLLADEDLFRALPPSLSKTMSSINLNDQPFHLQSKLVVSRSSEPAKQPEIYWDGQLWVRGVNLKAGIPLDNVTGTMHCCGLFNGTQLSGLVGNIYVNEATIFKQPIQAARVHLEVQEHAPDVMRLDMSAPLFGGEISGLARLDLGSTLRYEVDLTASQIQLEQFGRQNLGPDHQLGGLAAGRMHLQGHVQPEGDNLSNLEGNGSIDVPYSPMTRILNLPLLLDLLKFLGLRVPDRTLFEEAHAAFAIHGDRVAINKLEMLGNVISLYGRGEVNLDGSNLNLDMYPSWGRAEQVLPPAVRFIPSSISKQLLKIEMRGKIGGKQGDLQFHQRYVPGLMDPLLRTWSMGPWGN